MNAQRSPAQSRMQARANSEFQYFERLFLRLKQPILIAGNQECISPHVSKGEIETKFIYNVVK
jgi:hypothetical protein